MNFIEFLGIALAPSLTLGLVVFFAKNWFLERLKNSIKHEYDKSLEKFKGDLKYNNDKSLEKFKSDLKIENDKEIEEIKALLKNKTDVSLEDYRFQIEIRKKWLDDLRIISANYIQKLSSLINICDIYVFREIYTTNDKIKDEHYNEIIVTITRLKEEFSTVSFQLELMLLENEEHSDQIKESMDSILKWFKNDNLSNNFIQKQMIDYNSEKFIELKNYIENFKKNILALKKLKSEKL